MFVLNTNVSSICLYVCEVKSNKVFIITRGGVVESDCYTSLRDACGAADISYWTAVRNFTGRYTQNETTISQLTVNKIKGRGGKLNGG